MWISILTWRASVGAGENWSLGIKSSSIFPLCVHAKSFQSCPTFCNPLDLAHQAPLSWDSPGKNTGVGCHALLQGIFPTQWLNLHLLLPLHWEDLLEKEMTTHSRILAWEISWTEKPGGLQSMGLQKSRTGLSNRTTTTMEMKGFLRKFYVLYIKWT